MALIDIKTPQNVIIQYELAGAGQRIFAFIVDLIVLFLFMLGINVLVLDNYENETARNVLTLIEILIISTYSLYSEILMNGQTLGKKALGIKVMKTNGEELEFYDYFSRWSTRLIDVWLSSGILSLVMIVTTKSGQRLGDILAGTTVIRKTSGYGFRLKDILKLNDNNRENYEFEFPEARKLEERDVILIKNVINRFNEYENKANEMAIDLMTDKILQTLEIKKLIQGTDNKIRFLRKVISEYIILTR